MIWNWLIVYGLTLFAAFLVDRFTLKSRPARLTALLLALAISFAGAVVLAIFTQMLYSEINAELGEVGSKLRPNFGQAFYFLVFSTITLYPQFRRERSATKRQGSTNSAAESQSAPLTTIAEGYTARKVADLQVQPRLINCAADVQRELLPSTDEPGAGTSEEGDNWAYAAVAHELDTQKQDAGSWLKAFVESEGDPTQQKLVYIKSRVAELIRERHVHRQIEESRRLAKDEAKPRVVGRADAKRQFNKLFFEQSSKGRLAIWEVEKLVKLAIAGEVKLNVTDLTGKTLLEIAAMYGAKEAVTKLLDLKADPNASTASSMGALYYAEAAREHEIAAILRQRGARAGPSAQPHAAPGQPSSVPDASPSG